VLAVTLLAPRAVVAGGAAEHFGLGGVSGSVAPSCPAAPCDVVTRTTGFQASIGGHHLTMVVGSAGRVTSWNIALSAPTAAEISYFDGAADGPASAGLVALRHTTGYHFRVIAASPIVALMPYFGRTTSFTLKRPLSVHSGDILALTVPTWAPALGLGLDSGTAWRASRPADACKKLFIQTAATSDGAVTTSECVYSTARLAYGATVSSG
jgi:hypothetical protein